MRAHSPVELVLTDPLGRRLGFDPTTGTSYTEIPDASYGIHGQTLSDDGAQTMVPGIKTAWLNSPIDGNYTIEAIGTDTGSYHVDGEAYDENGGHSNVSGPSGTTTPNQVDTAVIHYSSQPAAVGGIAEYPQLGPEAATSANHSSGQDALELAGAAGGAALLLAAGGWYARRRWLH